MFGQCGTMRVMSEPGYWKTTQDLDGWVAEMTWSEGETQGGPSMLVVQPSDPEKVPAGGLSSTVIRQIDFRAGAAKLRELANLEVNFFDSIRKQQAKGPKPMDMVRDALAEGITDDYLSLLTLEYVGRVTTGVEKPVDKLAAELGKSLGTVKSHLWQARKRGLLAGGSAGRKGGQPTDRAVELAENWSMKYYPTATT
jgi:hypothetical protein